jgi:hypothetical protein
MLAYVTGMVDQELLLRNEYLVAENRILRGQIKGRLLLSEGEQATLAEIAHRLGRVALREVAATANPDTLNLTDRDFADEAGRPRIDEETECLMVQMAKENPSWGYDRIARALKNLGQKVSAQTVGNILRGHGLSPAPKRKQAICWKDFIRAHMEVLVEIDFFTVEVLTLKSLITYYVLFFIHLGSRRVGLAGMTPYPDEEWMHRSHPAFRIRVQIRTPCWQANRFHAPRFDRSCNRYRQPLRGKRIGSCFPPKQRPEGRKREPCDAGSGWAAC